MLTFRGRQRSKLCDGISRRDFLTIGSLGVGGLALTRCCGSRRRGRSSPRQTPKAVIWIYMFGGPSHIDMYDMKPNAPVEIRGEFRPIRTNVPGIEICELMPLQAKIADKFSIVRGIQTFNSHDPDTLLTGFPPPHRRSAELRLRGEPDSGRRHGIPPYVSHGGRRGRGGPPGPRLPGRGPSGLQLRGKESASTTWVAHPEISSGPAGRAQDLVAVLRRRCAATSTARARSRDWTRSQSRAFEMISSPRTRDAFDLSKESPQARAKYGQATNFLLARRLVEAGVSMVYLSDGPDWDDHNKIFPALRRKLPPLDRSIHALITDLAERGLDKHVTVLLWGEMGRSPRIGTETGRPTGRDHWAQASFALLAGGGLRMGQAVGDTGPRAERIAGGRSRRRMCWRRSTM